MLSDTQSDQIIVSKNQACSALLRCASYAAPIILTVSSIQEIVNNQQWTLSLTGYVMKTTLNKNHKKSFVRNCPLKTMKISTKTYLKTN